MGHGVGHFGQLVLLLPNASLAPSVNVPGQFLLSAACQQTTHLFAQNHPKLGEATPNPNPFPSLLCVARHFGNQSTNATTRHPTAFSLLGGISGGGVHSFSSVGRMVTYVAGRRHRLSTWQLVGWSESFKCSCSCSWASWKMFLWHSVHTRKRPSTRTEGYPKLNCF